MIPDKFTGFVKFSAEWCAPCKAFAPIVKEVAEERGIEVLDIDIDKEADLASEWNIRSIPMLISFKEGEPLGSVGSRSKAELLQFSNDSGF